MSKDTRDLRSYAKAKPPMTFAEFNKAAGFKTTPFQDKLIAAIDDGSLLTPGPEPVYLQRAKYADTAMYGSSPIPDYTPRYVKREIDDRIQRMTPMPYPFVLADYSRIERRIIAVMDESHAMPDYSRIERRIIAAMDESHATPEEWLRLVGKLVPEVMKETMHNEPITFADDLDTPRKPSARPSRRGAGRSRKGY